MNNRNVKITFRMTEAEQNELKERVKKSKLSQEAYIRMVLAGSVPRESPPADYYAMMRDLNAIGNRMNQIAAHANATGFFLADEYTKNARELSQTVLAIQAAVTLPERRNP